MILVHTKLLKAIIEGTTIGAIKGYPGNVDYSSHGFLDLYHCMESTYLNPKGKAQGLGFKSLRLRV